MESFKIISSKSDSSTNVNLKKNEIIKVFVSDILAAINKYDEGKGLWRTWLSGDHKDIISLKKLLRAGTGNTEDRLLDSEEMHQLLLILIDQQTEQNHLSSAVLEALRNKVGTDLMSLARLLHSHDPSIFTPHIINLLAKRKDNFNDHVKKIIELFIEYGIPLKRHICTICLDGIYSVKLTLVMMWLKLNDLDHNENLLDFIIENSSHTTAMLTWSLLHKNYQTIYNLQMLLTLNALIEKMENQEAALLSDSPSLAEFKKICKKIEELGIHDEPSMSSIWKRAKEMLAKANESQSPLKTSSTAPSAFSLAKSKIASKLDLILRQKFALFNQAMIDSAVLRAQNISKQNDGEDSLLPKTTTLTSSRKN